MVAEASLLPSRRVRRRTTIAQPCAAIARGRDARGEAGFTLVEMLVSLALTALIAMLLIQSLQATGLITRSAQRIGAQAEVQLVRGHLRRTLAHTVRRRRDGHRVTFLGQEGHLLATIAANREAERISEMQIDLSAIERPDGAGLTLVETTRLSSSRGTPEEREVLLDGIAGLQLRYFGVLGQNDPSDWQPRWLAHWSRKDRLPILVEVTVAFPLGDPRRWPPLIIPLGAGS